MTTRTRTRQRPALDEETLPIFILTHGRPENVITAQALERYGWTGPVYIVIDNEDSTAPRYREIFGEDKVIMFDKLAVSKTFDNADNFEDRRAIVFARNACFQIARDLGYRYFMEFDDDYGSFFLTMDTEGQFKRRPVRTLDEVLAAYLAYFKSLPPNVVTLAMAQGGDFLGGASGTTAKDLRLKRKAMNSFICDVERPFKFLGRINEDVNTYVHWQSKGEVMLTAPLCQLNQAQTQSNSGGMTDIYRSNGTYVKSFYTILFAPSCVKITDMVTRHRRLHHIIKWNNAVPKILSPTVRKP